MNKLMLFIHKTGSPPWFYENSGRLLPWIWGLFFALAATGLYLGLLQAPPDYLQGESARIMYVHVPSAYLSMMIYALMATMGFVGLVWHIRIAEILMISSAPIGATFTALALFTGAVWGKPTWGVWWIWDPRLTTTAILFIIYVGYLLVRSVSEDPDQRARWSAVIGIVAFEIGRAHV